VYLSIVVIATLFEKQIWGSHGRDSIVFEFTTILYAISAYHH
jgi:hypothetical protein